MAYPLLMKVLGFTLIWLSFVLVLATLLVSHRREHYWGQPYRHAVTLAVAIIGLCTMIALGILSAKSQNQLIIRSSFDRG